MSTTKSVVRGRVDPNIKMTGKTVLITGANAGLGFVSSIDLARRGARVIMACRNMSKAQAAKQRVEEQSGSDNVHAMMLDLSSFASIREFAEQFKEKEDRLDVLMNNAGVMMCPQWATSDGFEMQFGTNHLGHFLLTNLLLDLLKTSSPSRIVIVSSTAHYQAGNNLFWDDLNLKKNYTAVKAYAHSKLMNVLFSRELSKRLEGTGVTSYSLHPGVVDTELARHIGNLPDPTFTDRIISCCFPCCKCFLISPDDGAQTQIYCAVAPELANETGMYYTDCKVKRESKAARNDEFSKRLWDISLELTGLNDSSPATSDRPSPDKLI